MIKSKHIDKICIAVICVMLVVTVLFMFGENLGIAIAQRVMAYEAGFFDTSYVHEIDIVMDDWDSFIENCTSEEYTSCTAVIDGEKYANVAIRAKGNTSLSTVETLDSNRYSFKLEFDHYDSNKSLDGLDKLCLNNLIQDNTMMKDYTVYQLMREFGVDSPLCSFAYITVNGEDWGLYLAVEGIEDSFLTRNYGNADGDLYKPDSISNGGGRGNGKDFNMEDFDFGDTESDTDTTTQNEAVTTDTKAAEEGKNAPAEATAETTAASDEESAEATATDTAQPTAPQGDMGGQGGTPPDGMGGGEAPQGGMQGGQGGTPPDGTGGEAPQGNGGEAPQGDMGGMTPPDSAAQSEDTAKTAEGEDTTSADTDATRPEDTTEAAEGDDTANAENPRGNFTPGENNPGGGMQGGMQGGDNAGGMGGGMGSDDVKLKYIDDDPDSYSNIFTSAKTDVTDEDKERLISSLKNLSEYTNLENTLDTDEVLRYFVVHNFVCNGDSYTGSMIHNYYLYEEEGLLSMIPWDYNLAFGTFQGGNASSTVNSSIDSLYSGGDVDDRPMMGWIFSSEEYTEQYHQLFSQFIEEYFDSGKAEEMVTETAELIRSYVEKDPTKFCTLEEFDAGVSALADFLSLRAEAVSKQLSGDSTTVDTGSLNLTDMGTMNSGGGGGDMPTGNMPEMGEMNLLSFVTITDKDGNAVEYTDIIPESATVESVTLADSTVVSLTEGDMQAMATLDVTQIVSVTDSEGNTYDLSGYTITMGGRNDMNKMGFLSALTITDEAGETVDITDIIPESATVESVTLADSTVVSLTDGDMQAMATLDVTQIVSVTDSEGNVYDLSEYTLTSNVPTDFKGGENGEGFPQNNGEEGEAPQGGMNENGGTPPEMPDGDTGGFNPQMQNGEATADTTDTAVTTDTADTSAPEAETGDGSGANGQREKPTDNGNMPAEQGGEMPSAQGATDTTALWIWVGISVLVLAVGIVVAKLKKHY